MFSFTICHCEEICVCLFYINVSFGCVGFGMFEPNDEIDPLVETAPQQAIFRGEI